MPANIVKPVIFKTFKIVYLMPAIVNYICMCLVALGQKIILLL